MNVLIVLAHPDRQSFNGQITIRSAASLRGKGHAVEIADLYGEDFDPIEHPRHYEVRQNSERFIPMAEQRHSSKLGRLPDGTTPELARLSAADIVVFQFPLWWYGPPAILKGWFDRVMVFGEAYSPDARYENGVFKGRNAIISLTTGSPASTFLTGRDGEIGRHLWPLHFALHYLGFTVWPPSVSYGIGGDSPRPSALQQLIDAERSLVGDVSSIFIGTGAEPLRFTRTKNQDLVV